MRLSHTELISNGFLTLMQIRIFYPIFLAIWAQRQVLGEQLEFHFHHLRQDSTVFLDINLTSGTCTVAKPLVLPCLGFHFCLKLSLLLTYHAKLPVCYIKKVLIIRILETASTSLRHEQLAKHIRNKYNTKTEPFYMTSDQHWGIICLDTNVHIFVTTKLNQAFLDKVCKSIIQQFRTFTVNRD